MYRWIDHTAEVEIAIEAASERDVFEDVERVVEIVDRAGLAARVVRLRPLGVVKG